MRLHRSIRRRNGIVVYGRLALTAKVLLSPHEDINHNDSVLQSVIPQEDINYNDSVVESVIPRENITKNVSYLSLLKIFFCGKQEQKYDLPLVTTLSMSSHQQIKRMTDLVSDSCDKPEIKSTMDLACDLGDKQEIKRTVNPIYHLVDKKQQINE